MIDLAGLVVVLEEDAATLDDVARFSVHAVFDEDVSRPPRDVGREMERATGLQDAPDLRERDGVLAEADVLEDGDADAVVEGLVRERQRGRILDLELESGIDRSPGGDLRFEEVDAHPLPLPSACSSDGRSLGLETSRHLPENRASAIRPSS